MKKDVIILHAGLHKTGSSSIQSTMNGYDDGRMRYARLGSPNHSKFFDYVFSTSGKEKWWHAREGAELERWGKKMQRELQVARPRLLFSGERISTLGREDTARMVEHFAPHTGTIRFIAYARDPASYISSSFQQRVKYGAKDFRLPNERPFFRERLAHFFELMGRENVAIVPFMSFTVQGRDVVEDFCARVAAEVPPEKIIRRNESLSAEAVKILFVWNREGGDACGGRARKKLVEKLTGTFPGRFRLSRALTRERVDWSDVDWLEGMIGEPVADRSEGVDAEDAIVTESDLLSIRPETVETLRELAGPAHDPGGPLPQRIAAMLGALHEACARDLEGEPPSEKDRKRERRREKRRSAA